VSTIHVISHTHWDREWYQPFQAFRLKLVHLVDDLLALLADDPAYRFYMLDGQTIVLDDYLQMRPEREAELRGHVQSGRLLIGPWHVLADEFLVSPESLVRNLLLGDHTTRRFGPKMMVGYTPDPFGHIGQLPQILRGFGIETAALMRGLGNEPAELWWHSPDGSRVLLSYLRDSYSNAAQWPVAAVSADNPIGQELFMAELTRGRDALAAASLSGQLLFMQGTDHMEPQPGTAGALALAASRLPEDDIRHSTLPAYFDALAAAIDEGALSLSTVTGELRGCQRWPLLPGVLSARVWIKQRNDACETLLEKWAEPFSAWAGMLAGDDTANGRIAQPAAVLRQAWRLLMECHPHDSICGCSIDQVHDEMRLRFDQVDQVAEEIVRQSLSALTARIDTRPPAAIGQASADGAPWPAVVVFNPLGVPRTDAVAVRLHLPGDAARFVMVDEVGDPVPHTILGVETQEVTYQVLDRDGLMALFGAVQSGTGPGDMTLAEIAFRRTGSTLYVDATLAQGRQPNPAAMGQALEYSMQVLPDLSLTTFIVHAVTRMTAIQLTARDVPPCGYRTFWLRPTDVAEQATVPAVVTGAAAGRIENEYLIVEAEPATGTLAVTDKRTGVVYTGLNRLIDGGDCGDEYNYCPPADDRLVSLGETIPLEDVNVRLPEGETGGALEITYTLPLPAGLTPDRQNRTGQTPLVVRTMARVSRGVPRVDIVTEIDNRAADHRLRVHFPAPFGVTAADYDGHYDVVRRPVGVAAWDATWIEQPRPETHQRVWTDISHGGAGLMLAARGLHEVEVRTVRGGPGAEPHSEIALTLLRCVGWLSRDDFATRRGHAGPGLPTPGAQMIGPHRFEYALIPHVGDWLTSDAYHEAYAFEAPLRAVASTNEAASAPGVLPASGSLLRIEPAAFVLSAIKAAEDGQGVIVRGYNITDAPIDVTLRLGRPVAQAALARLDETPLEALSPDDAGAIHFTAAAHQIVTVRLGMQ
jgi:alpha-mannosidase